MRNFTVSVRALMTATLALAATLPAGCQRQVSTNSIEFITPARVSEQVARDPSKHLILDARDPAAYAEGKIPGAQLVTITEVDTDKRNPAWERYSSIVVYGNNPGSLAAEAVTKRLLMAGYGHVYLMDGGFAAWKDSGRPVQP